MSKLHWTTIVPANPVAAAGAAAVVLGAPKPANPVAAGAAAAAAAVATGVMVRDGAAAAPVAVVAAPKLRPPPRVGAAAVGAEAGFRTFKFASETEIVQL